MIKYRVMRCSLAGVLALGFVAAGPAVAAAEGAQGDGDAPGSGDKPVVDPGADYKDELPRIPPRSVEEGLQSFAVHPDFRVEVVAHEPLVVDPVAIDFDSRRRMYVVCMRGYSEQAADHLGQVRLLYDADGDGHYDRSAVFLDGLSWPTGVLAYDGGAYVAVAPDILYAKDVDGDGQADVREAVFTGYRRSNVQGLLNSLCWGLDNRVHGATSRSGAQVRAAGGGRPLELNGRDFSFDPRSGEMTATSGGAQHGLSFDDWGRKFVCSNSRHLEMVLYEDRYVRRNKYAAGPGPRVLIAADGGQAEVFRKSPVEPWRLVRTRLRVAKVVPGPVEGGGRAAGYFTGSTGVTIYRGDLWPAEFSGQAFIGDVGSNIVHRKKLTANGVLLRGERADEGKEFLASTDIWFRPVQFANAPDGSLYVLDMYREVIEHPKSLPPMIKKHLDLTSGRDRGRIYRIVPRDCRRAPLTPDREVPETTRALVALLEHPNAWHREMASRRLYARQDPEAAEPLRQLAAESASARGRLHALYALAGMEALPVKVLLRALDDPHPRVREHAVRLSERVVNSEPALRDRLLKQVSDPDLRVRYQLAFTLGELAGERRLRALARIIRRDVSDPWMRFAVRTSLADGAARLFVELAGDDSFHLSQEAAAFLSDLAEQVGREGDPAAIGRVMEGLMRIAARDRGALSVLLKRLDRGLKGQGALRRMTASRPELGRLLKSLLERARATALDRQLAPEVRKAAIETLALGSWDDHAEPFRSLLQPREPAKVQLGVLKALRRYPAAKVSGLIIDNWAVLSPQVRREASEVLLMRRNGAAKVVEAMENDAIQVDDLEPVRIEWLRKHSDTDIRERFRKLLAKRVTATRDEIFQDYRRALRIEGNAKRGEELFRKHCASCHRVGKAGVEVGPNLAAMRSRGVETMLLNILDPNREVDPRFLNYVAVTRDGRTITGAITAETATSLTFRRADQTETVLRADLARLQESGLSMMPEGLEKEISVKQMADLLQFLMVAK